jgi:hypothetical protein
MKFFISCATEHSVEKLARAGIDAVTAVCSVAQIKHYFSMLDFSL